MQPELPFRAPDLQVSAGRSHGVQDSGYARRRSLLQPSIGEGDMAKGVLGKIFGGDKEAALDSCCGAVSVTPEDETSENEIQRAQVSSGTESSCNTC